MERRRRLLEPSGWMLVTCLLHVSWLAGVTALVPGSLYPGRVGPSAVFKSPWLHGASARDRSFFVAAITRHARQRLAPRVHGRTPWAMDSEWFDSEAAVDHASPLPLEQRYIPNFEMRSSAGKPLVVGLAGGTGSGKSTMKDIILEHLVPHSLDGVSAKPEALVATLSHDNYYKHKPELTDAERDEINFDHPDSLETDLMVHHLKELLAGNPVDCPVYDFSTHLRKQNEVLRVEPRPIVLVEGILIFTNEMNLKIYVDVEADRRILRRIERDLVDRGRSFDSIVSQYLTTVKPMHDAYVEPSKHFADIIVPHGAHNSVAIQVVVERLRAHLRANLKSYPDFHLPSPPH